jgi:glutamate--cysteine ligase
MSELLTRLRSLSPHILAGLRRGIEKESLRVRLDGTLVATPHPRVLGAALTHPHITTDFSEAQLELITGVHSTATACLDELTDIHRFVHRHIGDEMLWCGSMPCDLPDEKAIPIARFGHSNLGRAKTLYRVGLSHRYGRRMQMISGIHYNFSLAEESWPIADFRDFNEAYFALIRNFRRHAWLLLYLFGASPAVCSSFVEGRTHELQVLAPGTLYLPHATSLRMGRLGYLSAVQDALAVSYNDLPSYAASLEDALTKPYPAYETIGVGEDDDYRQLATSLLQIENEFYSTIRPKRVVRRGERPLRALRERGVQYVEVRAMDLDPFSPIGITADTVRFLDIFLLHCLLSDSPPDTPREIAAIGRNKQRVAARGREPGLCLERDNETAELREWSKQLLLECEPIAAALDAANGGSEYSNALSAALCVVADPESLPSARVLSAIRRHHGDSYLRFALEHSLEHRNILLGELPSADLESRFRRMADESLDLQQLIEAEDVLPFETYRQQYLSPSSLRVR